MPAKSKKSTAVAEALESPGRILLPELSGAALVFFSLFSLLALYGPDRGAVLEGMRDGLSLVWGRHAFSLSFTSALFGGYLLSRRHKKFYKRMTFLALAWVLLMPPLDHLFATLLYGKEVITEHLWVFSAGGKYGNGIARFMVKGLGIWGALLTYMFFMAVLAWSRTGFSFKTVLQWMEDGALFLGIHGSRAWDALRPILYRLAGELKTMPSKMAIEKQTRETARKAALVVQGVEVTAKPKRVKKASEPVVMNEDFVEMDEEDLEQELLDEGLESEEMEAAEPLVEKPGKKKKKLNPFSRYEKTAEEDEVILHQEITSLEESNEEEEELEAVEVLEGEEVEEEMVEEDGEFEVETVGLCSSGNTATDPVVRKHDNMSYILPPSFLLAEPVEDTSAFDKEEADRLRQTLEDFNVPANITRVLRGPNVTRYELSLPRGMKVRKIVELQDEIAMSLAAQSVRIQAPIPGKNAIGVELPRKDPVTVQVRELLDSDAFHGAKSKLTVAIGKDVTGQPIVANLASMPHLLIAGATGQGKSVCLNVLITSLLVKATPFEVKIILIDPKRVEFPIYSRVPHLLCPVVEDSRQAINALQWVADEMIRRYDLLKENNKRNIDDFNNSVARSDSEKLPRIVVIVDELNDLLMTSLKRGSVEELICRIAQLARAAGIHLVLATQRPDVKVITGTIKANIPCRIAFATTSQVDSRTIIDLGGAEKLLGRGDMLFLHGGRHIQRLQGAFLSEDEIEKVVNFCAKQMAPQYNEEILTHGQETDEEDNLSEYTAGVDDDRFEDALRLVLSTQQASTSFLQRKLGIGYNRAARIIDIMEDKGIVDGPDPSKPSAPRKVLLQPAM